MSKPHVPEMPSTEQQLDRERDRSRLLLDINNSVVSRLSLRELLSAVSSSLREILPHDFAAVVLCEPDGQRVRVYGLEFQDKSPSDAIGELIERAGTPFDLAMTSRQTVLRHRIDLSEFPSEAVRRAVAGGLVSGCSVPLLFTIGQLIPMAGNPSGIAITSRATLLCACASLEQFPSEAVKHAMHAGLRSVCSVPLISHDQVLGSLDLASCREGAFTPEDAELLSQIGLQIAIGVENALNYERAHRLQNGKLRWIATGCSYYSTSTMRLSPA